MMTFRAAKAALSFEAKILSLMGIGGNDSHCGTTSRTLFVPGRMLAALLLSLALHLALICLYPNACTDCRPTSEGDTARIDARLVPNAARPASGQPEISSSPRGSLTPIAQTEGDDQGAESGSGSKGFADSDAKHFPAIAPDPHGLDKILITEPTIYVPTKELQIAPHPVKPIEPQIPDNASPEEVKVILRLWISAEGIVDRVVTVSGSADDRFARNAVTAFLMARFSPGVKDGVPVGTEMLVEVIFDRETIAESRSPSQR